MQSMHSGEQPAAKKPPRRFSVARDEERMNEGAIRTAYRRWAPVYDNTFGRVASEGRKHAVEIINTRSGRVLGVHLMDNAAPEIVQALAVALRLGVRESHLQTTVQLHPTVAEELFG